jgi:hypothetical protein
MCEEGRGTEVSMYIYKDEWDQIIENLKMGWEGHLDYII